MQNKLFIHFLLGGRIAQFPKQFHFILFKQFQRYCDIAVEYNYIVFIFKDHCYWKMIQITKRKCNLLVNKWNSHFCCAYIKCLIFLLWIIVIFIEFIKLLLYNVAIYLHENVKEFEDFCETWKNWFVLSTVNIWMQKTSLKKSLVIINFSI